MTTALPYHEPTLREDVAELLTRLARLQAAGVALRGVADSLGLDTTSHALVAVLDDLERDLALASGEANRLRAHASGRLTAVNET